MILTNPQERNRFYKFAVVGAIGAVIDFGTFNILTLVFSVYAVVSSVFSFIAAVTSNFFWNRFWTYPDSRSKPFLRQMTQFFLINVLGLGIRTPLFAFIEPHLVNYFANLIKNPFFNKLPFSAEFLGHNISLAIVVVVVMFWNFFANRYWTYSDVD
jgi:putative flippase GtrA